MKSTQFIICLTKSCLLGHVASLSVNSTVNQTPHTPSIITMATLAVLLSFTTFIVCTQYASTDSIMNINETRNITCKYTQKSLLFVKSVICTLRAANGKTRQDVRYID